MPDYIRTTRAITITITKSPLRWVQVLRVRLTQEHDRSVIGCRFVDLSVAQQLLLVKRIYGAGQGRLTHGDDTGGLLAAILGRLFNIRRD